MVLRVMCLEREGEVWGLEKDMIRHIGVRIFREIRGWRERD